MSATAFDFAAHIEAVARALLGKPVATLDGGREWRYGTRQSLSVIVAEPKRGTWHDYEADVGGGTLDLILRERGCDTAGALDWLRDDLGIDVPRSGRARRSTADYAAALARDMRPVAGTLAERYLTEVRGLAGPFPADIGFHPAVRAKGDGADHPALVCVARDGAGAVRFIHAVFLDSDGHKAGGLAPVKQTFGKMGGAAIRLPATDPEPVRKVALAEGVEDALSVAQASGLETWACCGVSNIGKVDVPRGAEVIVAGQNDPADKEATKTLHKAVRRLRGRGLRVIVAAPPDGTKDWNDLLKAAGPEAVRAALDEAGERADWRVDLIHSPRGEVRPLLANAALALGQDDAWRNVIGLDRFAHRTVMRRPAPWLVDHAGAFAERPWTDDDDIRTAQWLQRAGVPVSVETAAQAVQLIASDHPFHPVRTWLDGLKWDGERRIDTWLETYLGAGQDADEGELAYLRAIGPRWLIGAVARVFQPGCQADHCLILEGEQGLRKSTALRNLVGDHWFADSVLDLQSKDALVQLQGKWVIELAELDSLSRPEITRVKSFLTARVDRYPHRARRPLPSPRASTATGRPTAGAPRTTRASASSPARPTRRVTSATPAAAGASGRSPAATSTPTG